MTPVRTPIKIDRVLHQWFCRHQLDFIAGRNFDAGHCLLGGSRSIGPRQAGGDLHGDDEADQPMHDF